MKDFETYLSRHVSYPFLINQKPSPDLSNVIVIPCHDEDNVVETLSSLAACVPALTPVEVVIVLNSSEKDTERVILHNRQSFRQIKTWAGEHERRLLKFYPLIIENIPTKVAGVGMARKIGMDEAIRRFMILENPKGMITSLDADTLVDKDYLVALEDFYANQKDVSGASIYFEHPLEGEAFPYQVYQGIIQYELHLRYFINALRMIGYPFAYHTIGSAFTVRAEAYVRQGGMNTRQGGEDFYFLQKVIEPGHFSDLLTTRVIPSPRPSRKVPFGTGPEMQKFLSGEKKEFKTYTPDSFLDLADFFSEIPLLYKHQSSVKDFYNKLPLSVKLFLGEDTFSGRVAEILQNVASEKTFINRFYHWFNTFFVIKYLNHAHLNFFRKQPVASASSKLLKKAGITHPPVDVIDLLKFYRELDKNPEKSGELISSYPG